MTREEIQACWQVLRDYLVVDQENLASRVVVLAAQDRLVVETSASVVQENSAPVQIVQMQEIQVRLLVGADLGLLVCREENHPPHLVAFAVREDRLEEENRVAVVLETLVAVASVGSQVAAVPDIQAEVAWGSRAAVAPEVRAAGAVLVDRDPVAGMVINLVAVDLVVRGLGNLAEDDPADRDRTDEAENPIVVGPVRRQSVASMENLVVGQT